MDVPLGSIVRALRLPVALRPRWTTWLSAEQIDVVATAAGIASSVVESMTLGAYDGVALKLDPTTHRLDATFPFGAVRWSRFCPRCLSESNGRWKLEWRLGWAFACVRHNAVLVDHCPGCGKHKRRQQNYRFVPSPATCKCGHDLSAATTIEFAYAHPIIRAQTRIYDVIDGGNTSFGVFEGIPSSAVDVLAATRSLTNRSSTLQLSMVSRRWLSRSCPSRSLTSSAIGNPQRPETP